jgi:predicted AlkP superfamily pyrophosphatase or phosphodiesterase
MINDESLQAVNAAKLNAHFGKPLYDSYCFSRIPQTVVHLLTGEGDPGLPARVLDGLPARYDKVILLYVDAFGWRFFEQVAGRYPFLQRFVKEGVVSKLTTQFPSTTAAHMTTIHTGLPVGQTGVYEWFYYEPLVDRMISPLIFSFGRDKDLGTLAQSGLAPQQFFPFPSIYETLARHGVKSYIFQDREYTPAPYADAVMQGATHVPFKTFSEGLVNLVETVRNEQERVYAYLYFDSIDSIGHPYGPSSPHFRAEIDTCMNVLERLLYDPLAGKVKNTLLLITADHGQVDISPETTIYLNQLGLPIESWIKTNRQGELLVPGGSARDLFLYVRDEALDEAHSSLSRALAGHAEVYRVRDLIEQGYFGPPSDALRQRVANLVILPYEHDSVWWYEKGLFEQRFRGHHGGLALGEMETLLLALPL